MRSEKWAKTLSYLKRSYGLWYEKDRGSVQPGAALYGKEEGEQAMKTRHCVVFILALASLVACGPMSSGTVKDLNVRDWVGHSSSHLIQSWGKPHHDYPTADGGRAIGYMFTNQAVTGPKSQVFFRATNCMINFTVDPNGIIDDATVTGTKCRIGPHADMHPPANKT